MNATQSLSLVLIMVTFVGLEYALGKAQKLGATTDDNSLDLVGFGLLAAVTQPLIFWVVRTVGLAVAPAAQNAWAGLPLYAMVLLFLVGDDMMQYWWHRLSHSPMLWPLHRAHHSAQYMSARMIYRNNFFYYLAMPSLWISGILIYLGLGDVYLVYIVVKLAVITGAHSAVRWDEPLYKVRALAPLMWVVQRTISTPATHWAHHAMTNTDGVGHYTGNFGNLLFFWDVLFGTAHITRQYPRNVGLQDDKLFGAERWYVELFYPLFKSKRVNSALVPGGTQVGESEEVLAKLRQA